MKLRGLPFWATDDEIYEFLDGYNVVSNSLKYKYDENGRKSGQAAILFLTQQDA